MSTTTTHTDIYVTVIAEALEISQDKARDLFQEFRAKIPENKTLDQVLPAGKAEILLAELRAELPAIREWFLRGGIDSPHREP